LFLNRSMVLQLLQDTLILLSVVVLVIAFSSTFVFQAGLIFLLFRRFASTLISAFVYLAFTIAFHYISLNIRWDNPTASIFFTPHILILYFLFVLGSVIHYAMYKRSALLLVDPKYHGDSEWLRSKIRRSN
uniref:Transmembrane protein 138 n=1 Tax=Angiostrongylus cantonensis TaxID=6313 RepID=A0A0K0D5Q2_ANGCA